MFDSPSTRVPRTSGREPGAQPGRLLELLDRNLQIFVGRGDELLKLCRRAPDLFQGQSPDERARLIRLIESNASYDGSTLTAKYKEPFDLLAEGLEDQTGGPDDPFKRTFAGRVVRWAGRRTRVAAPATVFALAA